MDTRIRKTCHVCGKGNLLQLNNHLTQMHGWNSQMKKEYKLNQMGAGMGSSSGPTIPDDGDIFRKESMAQYEEEEGIHDEEVGSEEDEDDGEEEMEESDNDEQENDDDDFCSDDEESSDIWRKFRREVTRAYKEERIQKLNELREKYPDAPDRELKDVVFDYYRNRWIEEAAAHLKDIITFYEKFQDTSGFFDKIMLMREQLAKSEGEDEALDMAINLYKHKFGSLFSCSGFDIPK